MDRTSDEYRDMVADGYWVFNGELLYFSSEDSDYGYGPLFVDFHAAYGTDRYLVGWLEEDDSGEVAEGPA